jgi:hypothetical protein
MIADTEEELHEMAGRIGMKREWFQDGRRPHYDVSMSKRKLAVEYGTIEITAEELVIRLREENREMKTGVELITDERQRHFDEEGWTPEHDDEHSGGSMVEAAVCYALYGEGEMAHVVPRYWPWDEVWWKPSTYKRNLVKAGALIAAELDRVIRSGVDGRGEPSFRDYTGR